MPKNNNEIATAVRQVCEEKGIPIEAVIETIESALAAAYRKDFGKKNQNIKVKFDLETGKSRVFDEKTVVEDLPEEENEDGEGSEQGEKKKDEKKVKSKTLNVKGEVEGKEDKENEKGEEGEEAIEGEESASAEATADEEVRRFNPRTEVQLKDASAFAETGKKKPKKEYKVGDVIKVGLEVPAEYGRMAAQTAKQVIIQRLREVERANLYEEFKEKEHEVITGVVQRREGRIVLIDLGKATGIIPPEGQVPGERYESGQRIKIYVQEVRVTNKGPEIILSRASEEILRKIFYLEIPEISNGLVEIKSVAREAGFRSKIAVVASEESVDPIGSCVGQRGSRIQTIIHELGGEKVDIIKYSEEPETYIANALAPAKVDNIKADEETKTAVANVAPDQLSLAIGKGGQNVRLAARLTGWRIDVKEAKSDGEKKKVEDVKKEGDVKKDDSEQSTVNSEQ